MAPSTTTSELPEPSVLQKVLQSSNIEESTHPAYLHNLASAILHNLQYQHDWTSMAIHTHSTVTNLPFPRPIISGLPPLRAYIHPDEQIEIVKAEHETGEKIEQHPEHEWVLPTHLGEKWSLAKFSAVFDALETVPSAHYESQEVGNNAVGQKWRGKNRQKRLLLATLHDDSTVVCYIMHDGIAKPRQN